jgi:hypothetical protein
MKRGLITSILMFLCLLLAAQNTIKISTPAVSFLDGILTIQYDITGCETGEYVDIRLIVLNSKGDTIRPSYIAGDLGNRINCGFGKKIEWNMKRDGITIDEEIEVQVAGKATKQETVANNQPDSKQLSRGNVILSSIFVPGLGQAKASGKGGHLVFSGIVYGALGASFLYNLKSNKYYDDYLSTSGSDSDDFFNKSEKAYDLSQYLLYGAAGAWVVNFIWSATIPIKELTNKRISVSLLTVPGNHYLVSAKWSF